MEGKEGVGELFTLADISEDVESELLLPLDRDGEKVDEPPELLLVEVVETGSSTYSNLMDVIVVPGPQARVSSSGGFRYNTRRKSPSAVHKNAGLVVWSPQVASFVPAGANVQVRGSKLGESNTVSASATKNSDASMSLWYHGRYQRESELVEGEKRAFVRSLSYVKTVAVILSPAVVREFGISCIKYIS